MPRVERFISEERIPVQQAQLVDPRNFPADTSSAEALRVAGETAKDIGLKLEQERKVKQELAKRKRDAQDRIGITDANAIMDNAEREYALRIVGKPLTEHEAIRLDELNKARAKVSQLDLSPDAREIVDSNASIKADRFADIAELANIQATNKDALIKTSEAYETALIEGDIDSIVEAEGLLDEQLKNMPKAEAAKFKDELEERAVKEMERKALKNQMDRAALNPESTIRIINDELKQRKIGKTSLLIGISAADYALLSNSELQSIKKYAETLIEKAGTDSEISLNQALVDAYGRIRDGDTDIDAMMDAIDADPSMTDEHKLQAAEKIPTYFNKINSTKTADESSELIYSRLVEASELVERGAMSPAAFEEKYANLKEFLTRDDQRDIRSKDVVATKTMQNRSFIDATTSALPTFVERTESEMAGLILARQNAEALKDLDRVNFFNIAIKKNQAQRWNYGRFRKQLRSQIGQNPEWSQSQIFVAQEVLTDQLDMDVASLLREFDGQNPNRAIIKTPPSDDFKDIWKDLSPEDRAMIWSERMAGTPIRVLLGSEEVEEAKKK